MFTINQNRCSRSTRIAVHVRPEYATKQKDENKAKEVAEERYRDIKYRAETGKIVVTRRFDSVCKTVKKELLEEHKNTGRELPKNYAQVIDNYLIPILGRYKCHNITTQVLTKYAEERERMMGRVIKRSTANTHTSALNRVFRKAKELNYIESIPKLPKQSKYASVQRRSYFTNAEYKVLTRFMWRDLKDGKKRLRNGGTIGNYRISDLTYEIREMLRDVVLILANTGIRPGNELLKLKWNNIDVVVEDGKESLRFALTHTKTGVERQLIAYEPIQRSDDEKRYGCWEPLERIKNRFDELKGLDWDSLFDVDEFIFRLPSTKKVIKHERLGSAFESMLKRCEYKKRKEGLLRDTNGNTRTLYCLRHTYASRRRNDELSFDDLSVQMGTGVDMLEKYYSHFTVNDSPNRFSGHAQRAKQGKEQKSEDANKLIEKIAEQLESQIERSKKQDEMIAELMEQNKLLTEKLLNKDN